MYSSLSVLFAKESCYLPIPPRRILTKGGKDQTEFNNRGKKKQHRFTFNLSYPFQERYINLQRLATITPGSSKHHEREKARAIIKVITSFNKEDRIISLLPPPFHRILKRAAVPRENPPLQEVLCCSMLPPERKREREIQRVKDSSRTTELFDRVAPAN